MKLIDHLVVRMGKPTRDKLICFILSDNSSLPELLDLVRSGSMPQRMKGSWVLSGLHAANGDILMPHYDDLLSMLQRETIGGVKRELLRCFEGVRLTSAMADRLVVTAMDWVTDERQDLAVRYICYRLLLPLMKRYPALEGELRMQVDLYRLKFGRFP